MPRLQALLDINGDGGISFDEMMGVAKECLAAERAASASGGQRDPSVKQALDRFQAYLLQYSVRERASAVKGSIKRRVFKGSYYDIIPTASCD